MSKHSLPTIDGYIIDERLRDFRALAQGPIKWVTVNFDSDEGQRLIHRTIELARRLELELK